MVKFNVNKAWDIINYLISDLIVKYNILQNNKIHLVQKLKSEKKDCTS